MESPANNEYSLRRFDYALLFALCAVLFGFSLIQPRVFTTHETTHCLNVREMFQSGEYLIPTYGGRPWLERPPVPHWLTGMAAMVFGDLNREWPMRLGSILIASLAVLVFAGAAATNFGRTIGLMSGAILATMREFAAYAVGPEADIFLASTVTLCGALFLRLIANRDAPLRKASASPEESAPLRKASASRLTGSLLLFCALLGLTNWMKGPLFGMIFILLPVSVFFIWSRRSVSIRPFVSFWGLLVFAVIAIGWPLLAWLRYPDIVELWAIDYGVRWQSGYIGEPFWYYLVHQPWNIFPWTIPALAGIVVTARMVSRSGPEASSRNPVRFIWCWALLPVAFFSLFKGKHHHYMLSCLAPAAVLAAFGSIALWQWAREWPSRLRQPWMAFLLVGVPGSILLVFFGKKIPGPEWIRWMLIVGWPIVVSFMWWIATWREGTVSFVGTCTMIVAINCLAYVHRSHWMDSYVADRAFIAEVKEQSVDDKPLLVINDEHPLNSSWILFYLGDRTHLLHNHTFLRDDRIEAPIVHVVCRQRHEPMLPEFGQYRMLAQSARARGETSVGDRWTLYELKYHPHLARVNGNVRISPLQATGRKPGPYLEWNRPNLAAVGER